jgi:hypothetical protein
MSDGDAGSTFQHKAAVLPVDSVMSDVQPLGVDWLCSLQRFGKTLPLSHMEDAHTVSNVAVDIHQSI